MNFDVDTVVQTMLKAAANPLQKYWKTAEPVAKDEFTKIAQLVQQIATERATQTITKEDAVDRLEMAKDAAKCALDTQLGLATIAAEDAINAALGSISSIVNGCIGFAVI